MKTTIIKQSSYKVNYGDGMPLLVEVALYRIEKTIFSRPTPPYYIEVRNNGYISQEFLSEDWAIKNSWKSLHFGILRKCVIIL